MSTSVAEMKTGHWMKDLRWNVGVVGLGKLGTPVALAMSLKGHHVTGYDINPERMQKEHFAEQERGPNGEPSIEPLLRESTLKFGDIPQIVETSDIIFCAIQTPHSAKYEGTTRLPDERVDFDYTYLKAACKALSDEIEKQGKPRIVVIISTVLPGTIRREIKPLLSPLVKLCYNPFFIAMGTTIEDFLNPEFVLFGVDDDEAAEKARQLYSSLHKAPLRKMSIESAELTKVAYNTFISLKIGVVNALMEICHKTPGCDIDEVTGGLALATSRLWGPRYTRGGMGDGGGCHPRDNIAMSFLARKLDLSHDIFNDVMKWREDQTEWLAELAIAAVRKMDAGPIYILGKSFKPETNLTVGSPATLLANILRDRGYTVEQWDSKVDGGELALSGHPAVFVVATQHKEFTRFPFPHGSVVIDPFRYIPKQHGVEVIHVGKG